MHKQNIAYPHRCGINSESLIVSFLVKDLRVFLRGMVRITPKHDPKLPAIGINDYIIKGYVIHRVIAYLSSNFVAQSVESVGSRVRPLQFPGNFSRLLQCRSLFYSTGSGLFTYGKDTGTTSAGR